MDSMSFITNEYVGKILNEDLYSCNKVLLLPKGTCLTKEHVMLLRKHKIDPNQLQKSTKSSVAPIDKEQIGSEKLNRVYNAALNYSKKVFNDFSCLSEMNETELFEPYLPVLEQVFVEEDAIFYMQRIKNFDEYTYKHSLNVGLIASLIGKALELKYEDRVLLGKMGFLHDIGKMRVNEKILNKPDKLSYMEFEEIKKHTIYGYELLNQTKHMNSNILAGTLSHHERLDGSGYPFNANNGQIPYFVQILAVADIYDAISSNRVYQKGRSLFVTIKLLLEEIDKGRLNKDVVLTFIRFLMEKNMGKKVLLNNGEVGQIIFVPHEEPHKPIIMVGEKPIDLRKVPGIQLIDVINAKHPA